MANHKQWNSNYSASHIAGNSTPRSAAVTSNTSSPQRPRKPSAIVIGSGFSGLAAAHALHHASFEVVVLEARNRIGGRAFTDYSFGFPLDLGAAWLHGVSESNPLARLIADLQLPLYRTSGDDSVLYDHDLESYALYDEDGVKIPQDVVERVERVFEEMLEETRQICANTSEDMSMEHALTLVEQRRPDLGLQGVERRVLQWYLCRMEGWFATDLKNLSAKCWEEEDLVDGGHGLMVNGYLPVLEALAAGLDIRFNHRVISVDWSSAQDTDKPVGRGTDTAGVVWETNVEATRVGAAEEAGATGPQQGSHQYNRLTEQSFTTRCIPCASLRCTGCSSCDLGSNSQGSMHNSKTRISSMCVPLSPADNPGSSSSEAAACVSMPRKPCVHITTADGAVFSADVAIITLPAGVLRLSVGHVGTSAQEVSLAETVNGVNRSNCSNCSNRINGRNCNNRSNSSNICRSGSSSTYPSTVPTHPNRIQFSPPLPPSKCTALDSIGVGIENKIALLFSSCFWPSVEFLGVVADTPYACSYFLNLHKASRGERAVLVFMPAGRLAEEMEGMGESEAVALTMQQLRKIIPHAPEPIQARITTWGSDPFSLGSYSYDAVHAPPDVYDSLRAPLPPLFFAGEATSRPHPGTVHGAFSTGRQAAREAAEFVRLLGFGEESRMVRKIESKKHAALLPESVVSGGDMTGEGSILSHVEAYGNSAETHNNSLEQGQVGDSSTVVSSQSSLTQHVVSGEIEAASRSLLNPLSLPPSRSPRLTPISGPIGLLSVLVSRPAMSNRGYHSSVNGGGGGGGGWNGSAIPPPSLNPSALPPNPSAPVCYSFLSPAGCRFGHSCRFSHAAIPQYLSAVPPAHSALPQSLSGFPATHSALPQPLSALPPAHSALLQSLSALPQSLSALPPAHTALHQFRSAFPPSHLAPLPSPFLGVSSANSLSNSFQQLSTNLQGNSQGRALPGGARGVLHWNQRRHGIVKEIKQHSPDLICLQEVDNHADLCGAVNKLGYDSIFQCRTRGNKDGCANFWNTKRWSCVGFQSIEFAALGLRDNVALLTVLKLIGENKEGEGVEELEEGEERDEENSSLLVLANIHVLFNPNRGDIKLAQMSRLLSAAHQLSEKHGSCPVVVCGDFNATPASALYDFIASSQLDLALTDRRRVSGQLEGGEGQQQVRFQSASHLSQQWYVYGIRCYISEAKRQRVGVDASGNEELAGLSSDGSGWGGSTFALQEGRFGWGGMGGVGGMGGMGGMGGVRGMGGMGGAVRGRGGTGGWSYEELKIATGSDGGGTLVKHPLKLKSAYSQAPTENRHACPKGEPLLTSFHANFCGTVDYIWHTHELEVQRVLDVLPVSHFAHNGAMPTRRWPSDHFSLVAEFTLRCRPKQQ
ncbi:unnamed protein product [Closterium sp. Yama58-4]|nr:unnamed protein product [Closterium sp. Yama58-4]